MALTIKRLADTFVAEVRGVDLRRRIDEKAYQQIWQAFLDHGVLVLPEQDLTIEQHKTFSGRFGELFSIPVRDTSVKRRIADTTIDDVSNLNDEGEIAGKSSERYLFALGNQLWHSDLSFRPVPAQASLLHAREVASRGGETEFADLRAAYRALTDDRKGALAGLIAEHSLLHSRQLKGYGPFTSKQRALFPPALQPVVRVHPDTGKKNLFVGAHAARIVNMERPEGVALLAELLEFATRPQFIYSHRWAVHDLVVYDNRRTLHRGRPYDADRERRIMHRTTILGKGPTVVDGRIAEGM